MSQRYSVPFALILSFALPARSAHADAQFTATIAGSAIETYSVSQTTRVGSTQSTNCVAMPRNSSASQHTLTIAASGIRSNYATILVYPASDTSCRGYWYESLSCLTTTAGTCTASKTLSTPSGAAYRWALLLSIGISSAQATLDASTTVTRRFTHAQTCQSQHTLASGIDFVAIGRCSLAFAPSFGGTLALPNFAVSTSDPAIVAIFADTGTTSTKSSSSSVLARVKAGTMDLAWFVKGMHDVDGDGDADAYFQHSNGTHMVWLMEGGLVEEVRTLVSAGAIDLGWEATGAGDFDRDGDFDLYLQHPNGTHMLWLMEGGNISEVRTLVRPGTIDLAWKGKAAGDFDRDGDFDLYLQHPNGTHMLWLMEGGNIAEVRTLVRPGTIDLAWSGETAGDFDRDGDFDLYLQHPNGTHMLWLMEGGNISEVRTLVRPGTIDLAWKGKAAGDFDRDGDFDLYLQHPNGTHTLWLMEGGNIAEARTLAQPGSIDSGWTASAAGDVDRDGDADVYLQHPNGTHMLWILEAATRFQVRTLAEP